MVGIDERRRACQLCQRAEMIAAMATAFSNMIDGRPVESTDRTSDINPSNVQDIVGEFARGILLTSSALSRRRSRPSSNGRSRTPRSDSTSSIAPARKSWRARRSWESSSRARWVSRWPMRWARPAAPGRSSNTSPARRCVSAATSSTRCVPASKSMSRANRSASSASSRLELSTRDPGVEDRAGARLRQLRCIQASRARARRHRGRSSTSSTVPVSRPASSTS